MGQRSTLVISWASAAATATCEGECLTLNVSHSGMLERWSAGAPERRSERALMERCETPSK